MSLALPRPFPPAEARLVDEIPEGDGWQYEPKWDGFRCLAFRDGPEVELQSKALKPLTRYFPEVAADLASLPEQRFVLDGELIIRAGPALSFERLLERIHPAESRIRKLAREFPASFVAFDLLVEGERLFVGEPFSERRRLLQGFAARNFGAARRVHLSPVAGGSDEARCWLEGGVGLDGVVAKRLDLPYCSGERTGMLKVKRQRTADCVVGGFRYAAAGRVIGSLLLGLYGPDGLLHHVGFTSGLTAAQRSEYAAKLEPLRGGSGFTGNAPGGPSRWSTERSAQWEALRPELVVEVGYDHFSEGRFRHGTRLLRWRPDKAPEQCTFEQVERAGETAGLLTDWTS
ncbi:MAG: ATP-dependent DNA ligase [Deltaproteobacteria bacterium]|nr:ATP-dependent DNA ligase [Deltaproteobacteria bacterium]